MDLRVRLFAVLRERAGSGELLVEGLPDDLDVAGLKRELERRHPELGTLAHVAGVVGTRYVPDDTSIGAGDEVSLLPPVSGGAPTDDDDLARGVFELCETAVDPGASYARVGHPGCGAVVVFTGTTRDRSRGQDVARLEYEAFQAMAGPEMERIFEDCRARFGPGSATGAEERSALALRMLCVHRVGTVGVGEPSVVIAVASPHRDAAFGAARYLIDTLKERLPVWKKEVYGDGHHWIGDRS